MPWGLAIAAVLLALVEIALRLVNPPGVLPVEFTEGSLAYRSLVPELEAFGSPQVAVVGSSRARRGVLAPMLAKSLRRHGLDADVKNFSLGGARAEEIDVVIRRIAETSPPAKLILWAITPFELETRDERPSQSVRYLWRASDWLAARRDLGEKADAHLPEALRNEAARHSYVVRYRFSIRHLLAGKTTDDLWRRFANVLSPDRTELSPQQGGIASVMRGRRRNVSLKLNPERVRRYVGDEYNEIDWPHNYQAEYFERAVRLCKRLGISLLVIEMPTHKMLEQAMPKNSIARFRRYLQGVSAKQHVPFISVPELKTHFRRRDFREQSHLNYRGAKKYTKAIAPIVAEYLGQATH